MADENKEVVPELSPIELRAQEQGWVPKEEWTGEEADWRPAREFLDRGELFKKIEAQSRELKRVHGDIEKFAKHYEKVRETEYKRALADLKKQKRDALAEGDVDAVMEIDERIEEAREAKPAPVQVSPEPQINPIFVSWVERNSWYESNKAMRAYADRIGNELGATGMSPNEILAEVEREVKKEFATKFQNPRREKPSAVEGEGGKGSTPKADKFELSADEHRAMKRFVSLIPGMTEEKYIADLKRIKGVS
jgi:hypothetical protein